MKELPSYDDLKTRYYYSCENKGQLVNLTTGERVKKASLISIDGQAYSQSRIAFLLAYGYEPKERLHFIDGDSMNWTVSNMILESDYYAQNKKTLSDNYKAFTI